MTKKELVLTKEKIEELKKAYPRGVYKVSLEEDVFIFRPLFREEFIEVVNNEKLDTYEREELIVAKCVVWPEGLKIEDIKAMNAGIPTTIAEHIMSKSGFELASVEKL